MSSVNILDTGIKNCKNVLKYSFGEGNFASLFDRIDQITGESKATVVVFVDFFFVGSPLLSKFENYTNVEIVFVDTTNEPTTNDIDQHNNYLRQKHTAEAIELIVAIGGGATMDVAKATGNLLRNEGQASDYQGWDLVPNSGVYKIAIPTLSGTGSEATRTCVMTNKQTGLKLGMNSDHTVFDEVILDPELLITIPKNQYFYTGMDAYIHCVESLNGSYRNAVGDAFSHQSIQLCRDVFLSEDMMSLENRGKMMVASYLGGCAIASSYVGLIHPFSAGLSVVLGIHHCEANCIVMMAMEEFYPEEYAEFNEMVSKQGVEIERGITSDLSDEQIEALYQATIIHEKPLTNALGVGFKDILTREKVKSIFKAM
ncbi:iron-containing alcohol dehydrogenase family protein [Vibrio genomosp. F10]|uniref:iron-containing alcohol dehydrogenase family protein n=1 Tax=Vibrio genomosp. F10 TaxID=723171 RepID=UPI0002DACB2C|nr:iron-containing alcohol dehydrogenase family protein [Vibrio genomosp. F10]OEF04568.1 alcohol dehydrogenase [Vibrio genomosp. F10 str. 9ZB36]